MTYFNHAAKIDSHYVSALPSSLPTKVSKGADDGFARALKAAKDEASSPAASGTPPAAMTSDRSDAVLASLSAAAR
jgi:hypothetical protein